MNSSNICFSNACAYSLKNRVQELETDFESDPDRAYQTKRKNDLMKKISSLLGKEHAELLQEYTEVVTLRSDADAESFYRKGFDDALTFATEYAIYS